MSSIKNPVLGALLGIILFSGCNSPMESFPFPADTPTQVNLRLTLPGANAEAIYPFDPTTVTNTVVFTPSSGAPLTINPPTNSSGISNQTVTLVAGNYSVTGEVRLSGVLIAKSPTETLSLSQGQVKALSLDTQIVGAGSGTFTADLSFHPTIKNLFNPSPVLEGTMTELGGLLTGNITTNPSTFTLASTAQIIGTATTPGVYTFSLKAKTLASAPYTGYFTSWYETITVAIFPGLSGSQFFSLSDANVNQPPETPWTEPGNNANWPAGRAVILKADPSDANLKWAFKSSVVDRNDLITSTASNVYTVPTNTDISSQLIPNSINEIVMVAVSPWGASAMVTLKFTIFPVANIVHVSPFPAGNDTTGTGLATAPYASLGRALVDANNWASTPTAGWIKVAKGNYTDTPMRVNPGITIIGGCDPSTFAEPVVSNISDLSNIVISGPALTTHTAAAGWFGGIEFGPNPTTSTLQSAMVFMGIILGSPLTGAGVSDQAAVSVVSADFPVGISQCLFSADINGVNTAGLSASLSKEVALSKNWIQPATTNASSTSFGVRLDSVLKGVVLDHTDLTPSTTGHDYGILGGNGTIASTALWINGNSTILVKGNILSGDGKKVTTGNFSTGLSITNNLSADILTRHVVVANYILGSSYPGAPSNGQGNGTGLRMASGKAEIRGNAILGYRADSGDATGVFISGANNDLIIGDNFIAGAAVPSSGNSYGLEISASNGVVLERNRILSGYATNKQYGILGSNGTGLLTLQNNLIGNRMEGSASSSGMTFTSSAIDQLHIYNNTFVSYNGSSTAATGPALNMEGTGNWDLKNNLFIAGAATAVSKTSSVTTNFSHNYFFNTDDGTDAYYNGASYFSSGQALPDPENIIISDSDYSHIIKGGTLVNTRDMAGIENFFNVDLDKNGSYTPFSFAPDTNSPWGLALAQNGIPLVFPGIEMDLNRNLHTPGPSGSGYNYTNTFWSVGAIESDDAPGPITVTTQYLNGPVETNLTLMPQVPYKVWYKEGSAAGVQADPYFNPLTKTWHKPDGSPVSINPMIKPGHQSGYFVAWMPGTNQVQSIWEYTGLTPTPAIIYADGDGGSDTRAWNYGSSDFPFLSLAGTMDLVRQNFPNGPVEIRLNQSTNGYKAPTLFFMVPVNGLTITGEYLRSGATWTNTPGSLALIDSGGFFGGSLAQPESRFMINNLTGPLTIKNLRIISPSGKTYTSAVSIDNPNKSVVLQNNQLEGSPALAGGESFALTIQKISGAAFPEVTNNYILGTNLTGGAIFSSTAVYIASSEKYTLNSNRIYGGNRADSKGIVIRSIAADTSDSLGVIHNNLIVGGTGNNGEGILIESLGNRDVLPDIFNNTVFGGDHNGYALHMKAPGTGKVKASVVNNIFFTTRALLETQSAVWQEHPNALPNTFEYNLLWVGLDFNNFYYKTPLGGENLVIDPTNQKTNPLLGFKTPTKPTDQPSFLSMAKNNNWDLSLTATYKNQGKDISGFEKDILGNARIPGLWLYSIGAYEED